MTTTAGTQNNTGDLLNTLIELTHDVNVAYEAAIDRTDNEAWLKGFHDILRDNQNQLGALRPYAERLTQNVSDSTDVKGLLNKGAVRLASLIGEGPLMGALTRIQSDMVTAYTRACAYEHMEDALKGLFARHREQAEGQLAWLKAAQATQANATLDDARSEDLDEVTRGRATPRTVAQTDRIDQSTDY
jgi:hypothetical protein